MWRYTWLLYSILLLDLDKQRGAHIYKKKLIFLFFDGNACVEQESSWREFVHTKELSGVRTTSRNWLQPKFLTLYSLKAPTWLTWPHIFTHALLLLYWSQLTPTYFSFFSSYFVDFIYNQMYLLTTSAEFIAGQCNILQLHTDIFFRSAAFSW